jgi:hypothetical protein
MSSVLKKDFKRLILDTVKVQKYVEDLGEEREADAGGRPKQDLTPLASWIVQLDFDLRTMLLDCAILGRQYWKTHNLPLIKSLHCSLDIMHHLLNDLNSISPGLETASLGPPNLRRFLKDWIRFKKSVINLQISLQHLGMRRKMMCNT